MAEQCLDRVEEMKRYLDEHAAEIRRWDFGHVHFDWNPGDIKTHIGQSDRIPIAYKR